MESLESYEKGPTVAEFFQQMSEIMDKIVNTDKLFCDEANPPTKSQMKQFLKKFLMLDKSEVKLAFQVTSAKFFEVLNQMVACVSCRRSAETFYKQLGKCDCQCEKSPFPLYVEKNGTLSLTKEHVNNKFLCALFNCPSENMKKMAELLRKSKPGKRCALHSIDSQKLRSIEGACSNIWDYISGKGEETSVYVDAKTLLGTIEHYSVRRHFCNECRSQVLNAYNVLIGESDGKKVSGYMENLYQGISFNGETRSILVSCQTPYFENLIRNALIITEELQGIGSIPCQLFGHKDSHVKTMEMAQNDVLNCLGMCIFERLHNIQSRCREQKQTGEIVMCVAVETFRRKFEQAIEEKQGVSQLELLCEELNKTELADKQRKDMKKLKRKQKKMKKSETNVEQIIAEEEEAECMNMDMDMEVCIAEKPNKDVDFKTDNKTEAPEKICNSGKPESRIAIQNYNLEQTHTSIDANAYGDSVNGVENKVKAGSSVKNVPLLRHDVETKRLAHPGALYGSLWQNSEKLNEEHKQWMATHRGLIPDIVTTSVGDCLPYVDKSFILAPEWKAKRETIRGELRANFDNWLKTPDSKDKVVANECNGNGEQGASQNLDSDASAQPKECNGKKKPRIPRPGGMNKSRKNYKGKNRL